MDVSVWEAKRDGACSLRTLQSHDEVDEQKSSSQDEPICLEDERSQTEAPSLSPPMSLKALATVDADEIDEACISPACASTPQGLPAMSTPVQSPPIIGRPVAGLMAPPEPTPIGSTTLNVAQG